MISGEIEKALETFMLTALHSRNRIEYITEINAKTSDLHPSVMCASKSKKGDSLCFLFLCSSKYIFYLFLRYFTQFGCIVI